MQGAFVSWWSGVREGMEKQALELGAEVNDWWGKRAAEGKCTAPELFFSGTRGGRGLWMVKGDLDVLHGLERTAEVQHLLMKSSVLLEDFEYDLEFTGDGADEFMGRFAGVAAEVGLM